MNWVFSSESIIIEQNRFANICHFQSIFTFCMFIVNRLTADADQSSPPIVYIAKTKTIYITPKTQHRHLSPKDLISCLGVVIPTSCPTLWCVYIFFLNTLCSKSKISNHKIQTRVNIALWPLLYGWLMGRCCCILCICVPD